MTGDDLIKNFVAYHDEVGSTGVDIGYKAYRTFHNIVLPDDVDLFLNISRSQLRQFGQYQLCISERAYGFLENSFIDPLHPLPEERILFEIENGEEYPL